MRYLHFCDKKVFYLLYAAIVTVLKHNSSNITYLTTKLSVSLAIKISKSNVV